MEGRPEEGNFGGGFLSRDFGGGGEILAEKLLTPNFGGILAGNFGGEFWRGILAGNFGGEFWRGILAEF